MILRRRIFRVALAACVAILILVIAGIAVLRSAAFHRYVLTTLIERAHQSTGGRAEIGSFQFHWSGLHLDLYRVVLHGTESSPNAPLFEADHIEVGLKILSLWRRKIDLKEIVIDHPSVDLRVDRGGRTNIPQPANASGTKPVNLFELAIGHFVIHRGEVAYNDGQTPVDAELRDLQAEVSFEASKTEYDGSLGYRGGRVWFGSFNPLQHDLDVSFTAAPAGLTVSHLRVAAGNSSITLEGHLQDYNKPAVNGAYQASISTGELGIILNTALLPQGQVAVEGTLQYRNDPNRPILRSVSLTGEFTSPVLALHLPQAHATLSSVEGSYQLSDGTLVAHNLRANALAGSVTADLSVVHLEGQPSAHVTADARSISVAAASAALDVTILERAAVSGRLDGRMEAAWQGSIENLNLHADGTLSGLLPVPKAGSPARSIPLQGAVHLAYDARNGVLALRQTELGTPHSRVDLEGILGDRSNLQVQARSGDLGEVDGVLLALRRASVTGPQSRSLEPQPIGVKGSAAFDGTVQGPLKDLRVTGQLSASNLQYQGATVLALNTRVAANSSRVVLSQGQLQTAPRGQVQFEAAAGLSDWSYTPRDPIHVQLTASNLPVAAVERLANVGYPVDGTLSARVSVQGTPSSLAAQGFARLSNASVWNQPVRDFTLQFQGSGESVHAIFNLRLPDGSAGGEVTAGLKNWHYVPQDPIQLEITAANLPVAPLENLASVRYPVDGMLSARVSMRGTPSNPTGQGFVRLSHASLWSQPVRDLTVQFQGSGNSVRATFSLSTPAGSGRGQVTYDPRRQAYSAEANFPGVQLERLQAVRDRNLQVTGVLTASAQGQGTLKEPQLEATVAATKLRVDNQSLDGLNFHATLAQAQAAFTLDSVASGVSIHARGGIQLNSSYDATMSLDTGTIQLGPLLATYLPGSGPDLHGATEIHASLKGPLKRPKQLDGQLTVPAFELSYQDVHLKNASPIHASYQGGVLKLDATEFKGTDTDLQVQGSVPLEHAQNLQVNASGHVDLHLIQLLSPGWTGSGQIKLNLSAQGALGHPAVQGLVSIADGSLLAPGAPIGANKINATISVSNGRADIQSFTAEAGGGTVSVQGFATYQPAVQLNLNLSATGVRVRYPVGVRSVVDSTLSLAGSQDSALLSGQVVIDGLSLTNAFDLATFANQFTGSSIPTGTGLMQNLKLNVAVRSGQEMALASNKLSLQGTANLRVQGTAAEPVILGRADVTSGEVFFNNQRYQVESGVIQFVNPIRTEPVVNLLVTTTVNQFNLTLSFVGPIDRLRTTYTSDPPLAPIDIINLLVQGTTVEAAAANPSTPESVIAGQLSSQVSSRLGKLAGISALTIDPQVGGGQGNAGGRLAVQQRVTKNLLFTFSTSLATTQGQIVQVEYQISRKYALSTLRDQSGGYTVEVKVRKSF